MATFTPTYEDRNVIVGLAAVYWRPFDPAVPAALPANTVDLGGVWPTGWKPIGATDSGVEFQFERSTNEVMIEEQANPVDEVTETLTFSLNVTLAEDTFDSMLLAYGGGEMTTTAAGAGTPGLRTLKISQEAQFIAVAFETLNVDGFWRRVLIPRAKSIADVATSYSRKEDKRMYEIAVKSLCSVDDVVIVEKFANAA